ncbi:MAG: hypothetical protein GY794_06565 [bacterium]|nr:hypothetical protein [bacterium]
MGSPYRHRTTRFMNEGARELLENMRENYLVVKLSNDQFYFPETDCGMSLGDIVRGLSSGEYDFKLPRGGVDTPIAIARISFIDNEAEIVTEKVAEAILDYRVRHDDRRPCPFLDQIMDGWRRRSGLSEEAAQ